MVVTAAGSGDLIGAANLNEGQMGTVGRGDETDGPVECFQLESGGLFSGAVGNFEGDAKNMGQQD